MILTKLGIETSTMVEIIQNTIQINSTFHFYYIIQINIMGDKLLLNFGAKFQP